MNLYEEIDRQKSLMGICENPHEIKSREFGTLNYRDRDVLVFEYRDGNLLLAPHTTHGGGITSFYQQTLGKTPPDHENGNQPMGRIWMSSKLITFWRYPATQGELIATIEDIYREAQNIRKKYRSDNPNTIPMFSIQYVEIPWDLASDTPKRNWSDDGELVGSPNFKIVNVENFEKYYKV